MSAERTPTSRAIGFFLENPLLVALVTVFAIGWGLRVAPFDIAPDWLPRDPVAVDAIPDTGENQQIVFTRWPGRSPQDVEDQVTYPLTVALLGVPGVETIRSSSMFGVSSVFVIFEEDVEFYWSRSRLVEQLGSLPAGTLPDGVQPTLGPDATPLGQVFWYTLEGRDEDGRPTGGWDLNELRAAQDWHVRDALASVSGVAEVASIGGFVEEYQIDVDPDAMAAHGVTLEQVFGAVRRSNVDVGARTIEINRAEYVVRGLGRVASIADLEEVVVGMRDHVPVTVRQIATVSIGPALRRGALDKSGTEAVGGVVVARHGSNPLATIDAVKARLAEIAPGLPSKVLEDGRVSRVSVVPFYDRTGLIRETLATLSDALEQQVLVTILVVLVMLGHLRSAALVSSLLPLAVLVTFVAMKLTGVDANVVALSGIAIAIGTMVDVGIVLTESVLGKVEVGQSPGERLAAVRDGASEVGGAVLTAVLTTVVGFLPVFTMTGAEGKLFGPLAATKTYALVASILVGLVVVPPAALLLLGADGRARRRRGGGLLVCAGVAAWWGLHAGLGAALVLVGAWRLVSSRVPDALARAVGFLASVAALAAVTWWLAHRWAPLGPAEESANLVFTVVTIGGVLLAFRLVVAVYEPVLRAFLRHKLLFLAAPALLVVVGLFVWLGFARVAAPLAPTLARLSSLVAEDVDARDVERSPTWVALSEAFPGLGAEFMPRLDEGSFLLMPVTMAHASIGEAFELMQLQDRAIRAIPEVDEVVGKIGRAETALDPAPVSMVETVISYHPEYVVDADGRPLRFAYDEVAGRHVRDARHELVPDDDGRPYRVWRDHIRSPDDVWAEIERAAEVPGMTTASMLQPIETRRIMLQTGMRASMGVKIRGPDLATIERVALDVEAMLKDVPSIRPETVLADRVTGKPYLEIDIDRAAIARYGLSVRAVQDVIEVAIGGRPLTTAIEGRERHPVRVRYARERRDEIDDIGRILVATPGGAQVPLGQLADVRYTPGPQLIRGEDTYPTAYVIFDRRPGRGEVDVVEDARAHLAAQIDRGAYRLPTGVSYRFAGAWENQQRAAATLRVVLPAALFVIFVILYLQFRSAVTTTIVFTSVFVAWSGGFAMLWLYGQDWFLATPIAGIDLRDVFGVAPLNLSVAVWVGFLALFGIATDDGVIMATYVRQTLDARRPATREALHDAIVAAGARRIRPCLMTTATTTLALLPVITSTGRGSDVMGPMAIPTLGGMTVAVVTIFVVPVLQCAVEERRLRRGGLEGAD